MSRKIALFPGSFDPFTIGHESVVNRAMPLFDQIIIAIGENTKKPGFFSLETRLEMISEVFRERSMVSVTSYKGLTVDFCREMGARYLLRGLRTASDFEYERAIAQMNKAMYPQMESVFLLTTPAHTPINSTIVREIILNGVRTELYEFESIDESEQGVIRLQELVEDAGGNMANEFSWARIWSHDRLIIVYFGRDGGTILLLSGLLGDPLGEPSAPVDKPFPPAIPSAMQALAEALGISPTLIEVVSFETVVWSDSCLGYPEQSEGCDDVETPGWKILLSVDQRDYEIHTDELGLEVRFSP